MKRLLLRIGGMATLTLVGGAVSFWVIPSKEAVLTILAKEAVRKDVLCPTDQKTEAQNFQVLSTHSWSQGVVVLFSAVCPGRSLQAPMQPIIGHKIVKQNGMQWQISGSGSYSIRQNLTSPERLVDYGIHRSRNQGSDRYAVLYGQVLKSKVAAVEVTFDNGQILRDRADDGLFALVGMGATGVCEVRVIGPDNQILKQEDLAMPKQLMQDESSHQCLPVTQQL